MKILKERINKRGKIERVVELEPGEDIISIREDRTYQLSYPLEDMIVYGYHLKDSKEVTWDVVTQQWVT